MKERKQMRERVVAENSGVQLIYRNRSVGSWTANCKKKKLLCGLRERLRILDVELETILVFEVVIILNEKVKGDVLIAISIRGSESVKMNFSARSVSISLSKVLPVHNVSILSFNCLYRTFTICYIHSNIRSNFKQSGSLSVIFPTRPTCPLLQGNTVQ